LPWLQKFGPVNQKLEFVIDKNVFAVPVIAPVVTTISVILLQRRAVKTERELEFLLFILLQLSSVG